ncbi:MAG: SprT family zinc-dependent metalloprotease [Saccharospirillum sp.]|uniref:M48 family metallopeptidase n=1 Tax=Saccharospirillum sp. TaxID=2033801 RepID=UPI00329A26FA
MSIDRHYIIVSDIPVEVVRKNIKNLHLGVYPPGGVVRISVPVHLSDDNARLAVISRLPWIKRKQEEFKKQPRQSERHYVSGESHYFKGRRYILDVVERKGAHAVKLRNNAKMTMLVNPGTSEKGRRLTMDRWYRKNMKEDVSTLLENWLPAIDKPLSDWGIKRMKTKWGSCNTIAGRIWLNLELVKKSPECLEYILVHELIHLYERNHNERFIQLMDQFLPNWRRSRDVLKSEPLAFESWTY